MRRTAVRSGLSQDAVTYADNRWQHLGLFQNRCRSCQHRSQSDRRHQPARPLGQSAHHPFSGIQVALHFYAMAESCVQPRQHVGAGDHRDVGLQWIQPSRIPLSRWRQCIRDLQTQPPRTVQLVLPGVLPSANPTVCLVSSRSSPVGCVRHPLRSPRYLSSSPEFGPVARGRFRRTRNRDIQE